MSNEQNMQVSVFIPQTRTIDIVDQNNKPLGTFEILMDEIDLMKRFSFIQEISQEEGFKDDVKSQIKLISEARSFIDEILGEGALKQITGGRSIGLSHTVTVLKMVIAEVMRVSNEKIGLDYE